MALIQSQTMTPAEVSAYRSRPQEGRHHGQPQVRHGRASPTRAPVYFTIGQEPPNWIKPRANAAAPAPTTAQ